MTTDQESRAVLTCLMSDGPSCLPLDKYYHHSRLIYQDPNIDALMPTKYGQLWSRAQTYAKDDIK